MSNINQKVLSLDLAKRLVSAGIDVKSHFWNIMKYPGSLVLPGPSWEVLTIPDFIDWKEEDYISYPAPLLSELLDKVSDDTTIRISKDEEYFCVRFINDSNIFVMDSKNPTEAFGELLLLLKEKNLLN